MSKASKNSAKFSLILCNSLTQSAMYFSLINVISTIKSLKNDDRENAKNQENTVNVKNQENAKNVNNSSVEYIKSVKNCIIIELNFINWSSHFKPQSRKK